MTTAEHYAHALFELVLEYPSDGSRYLKNLSAVLERRGHSKLLPRIYSEYQMLELRKERAAQNSIVTPEQERTRTLLELYRKLVAA